MILRRTLLAILVLTSVVSAQELEVATTVVFTEGPTVDGEGNVYFTDLVAARIMRLSKDGVLSVFRENSNYANGLVLDSLGRLIAAEGGPGNRPGVALENKPRLTRTDVRTGAMEVLADHYEGKPFAGLNDVTIDSQGRIYVTDPDGPAVYRIDAPGRVARLLTAPEIRQPGGIQVSPDDKTLYVGEYSNAAGVRLVRAYDLQSEGSVSNMRVLYEFQAGRGPDGISIDTRGNLYIAAGLNTRQRGPGARSSATAETKAGIYVVAPTGHLIRVIPIPEDNVTNSAFGGPEMRTLYVTAGKTVFRIRNDIAGMAR